MTEDDHAWFEQLYKRHEPIVRAYLRGRGGQQDLDDLTAEVFVVAWRRRAQVPRDVITGPWLIGVARNISRMSHRTALRQRTLREELGSHRSGEELGLAAEPFDVPLLGLLELGDRELLLRVAFLDLCPADFAAETGCTAEAARARMYRARTRARQAHAALAGQARRTVREGMVESTPRRV